MSAPIMFLLNTAIAYTSGISVAMILLAVVLVKGAAVAQQTAENINSQSTRAN